MSDFWQGPSRKWFLVLTWTGEPEGIRTPLAPCEIGVSHCVGSVIKPLTGGALSRGFAYTQPPGLLGNLGVTDP